MPFVFLVRGTLPISVEQPLCMPPADGLIVRRAVRIPMTGTCRYPSILAAAVRTGSTQVGITDRVG